MKNRSDHPWKFSSLLFLITCLGSLGGLHCTKGSINPSESTTCTPGYDCNEQSPPILDPRSQGGADDTCILSPINVYPMPSPAGNGFHYNGYDFTGTTIYAPADGIIRPGVTQWGSRECYTSGACFNGTNCPCTKNESGQYTVSCAPGTNPYYIKGGSPDYDVGVPCYNSICRSDNCNNPNLPCSNHISFEFVLNGKSYLFRVLHIERLLVKPGANGKRVEAGTPIAVIGNTGFNCTGSLQGDGKHGHIEMYEYKNNRWTAVSGWNQWVEQECSGSRQLCVPGEVRCLNGVAYTCETSGKSEKPTACTSGSCKDEKSCTPQSCSADQIRCFNGLLFTCNSAGTSETSKPCSTGTCKDEKSCTPPLCNPESTRCTNGVLFSCDRLGLSERPSACPTGKCQDDKTCVANQCSPNGKRCTNGVLFTCNAAGTSENPSPCPSGSCLDQQQCEPRVCTPNVVRCVGGILYTCNNQGSGESSSACPTGQCQDTRSCAAYKCTPNATRCVGGVLFTCNGAGTTETSIACGSGSCQDSTVCTLQICTPHQVRCSNGTIYTCNATGTSETSSPCNSGTCQDIASCKPQTCSPNDRRCNNGVLFTCNSSGTAETPSSCASGSCKSLQECTPQTCTPNTSRCSSGTIYTCNAAGTSETSSPCKSNLCQGSVACQPQSCTPNQTRCSNGVLFSCNSSGTIETPSACDTGACQDLTSCIPRKCTPNISRCSGGTLYQCNTNGTVETSSSCPTGTCQNGNTCASAGCGNGNRKRCWLECGQKFASGCFHADVPARIMGISTCINGQWSSCATRDNCSYYTSACNPSSSRSTSYECLDSSIKTGTYVCSKPLGSSCNSAYYSGWGPGDCNDLCTGSGDSCTQAGQTQPCTVHCDSSTGPVKQGTQTCRAVCNNILIWGPCNTNDACAP